MVKNTLEPIIQRALEKMELKNPSFHPHEKNNNELTTEGFLKIGDMYFVQYKFCKSNLPYKTVKGKINFNKWEIILNPAMNEDGITFTHEIAHHWFEKFLGFEASEDLVENTAKNFYSEHKQFIDSYVAEKLKEPRKYTSVLI